MNREKQMYVEEEEDKVKWMKRIRSQFFRKCQKRSGEEGDDEIWRMRRMRMRKD